LKRRIITILAIMILVAIAANWMVTTQYSELAGRERALLIVGGALLSGVISLFLFRPDEPRK